MTFKKLTSYPKEATETNLICTESVNVRWEIFLLKLIIF